ncbi:MAG: methylenetetrahydrofolate dehydrogenase [Gemmatimonadetes bacterium]|nr:MAG: methylenetetrahydrofolate dehydrogenase [Gemmatimonadota bacterium]PYO98067.1 MAG: methylenetetrahydrofolate dehydrogenase [Gemmatimonadota bacterium]TLY53389.1 MAG: methylenetetrahydrofolate dehydrogenase [Gemmatimonadota bacterium]
MRKLLLQLDSSRLPSVFDQVVAYDAGADQVMSYGGVTETDVRDLILGCLFTRGPKDLHNTAVWIGGSNMAAGEQLLAIVLDSMFSPFNVSVMLDSNGSNTTAVAAVVKIEQAVADVKGKKVVVLGGTGPVGQRAAGLLAKAGARVTITSRKPEQGEKSCQFVNARFGVQVESATLADAAQLPRVLDGVNIFLNAGAAGVQMVSKAGWTAVKTLKIAVDLNAVPPLGIEGIEVNDAGIVKEGVTVFGAFGIGNFKTKLHKACIARLFERNDLVLDAETIADVARELMAPKS